MASILGHFTAGFSLSKLVKWKIHWSIPFLATISAFLPDIDVISFKFGIPYEDMFGHRGFTHSIFFAFIWAAFLCRFYKNQRGIIFTIFFLATVSHLILDALTTGGLGVAVFAPFNDKRYFFPWEMRVIRVSPIGIKNFMSSRGWIVVKSELIWVVLPCIIFMVGKYNKMKK